MLLRTIILNCFLLLSISVVFSQKKDDIYNYINTYKTLAIAEMKRSGVPASIKLAQGIHETMAGTSDLVLKSNNHFGIKCKTGWAGNKVYHDDDAAGECFRSYAKAEDSYVDHSNFLKGSARYAFLFDLNPTDYEGWAYGLKKAGYATNVKYSQIIIRLIQDYNLQQYSLIALGRMKPSDEVLPNNTGKTVQASDESVYAQPIISNPSPPTVYPQGEFLINNTKVFFAKAGTSWLSIAEQRDIPLNRLLDFNDLKIDDAIKAPGQLVFIQRKRKVSDKEYHLVQKGETMYDICQKEGIRLESLLSLNRMYEGMEAAPGQKLNLQNAADKRPLLIGEKP